MPTPGPSRPRCPAILLLAATALATLAACGELKPGTPGHEPPSGGRYNPISHEVNESGR